jgi:hypothetical protein
MNMNCYQPRTNIVKDENYGLVFLIVVIIVFLSY